MRRNVKLQELALMVVGEGSSKCSRKANKWLLQHWEEYLLHLQSATKKKHLPLDLQKSLEGMSTGLKDPRNFLRNKKKVYKYMNSFVGLESDTLLICKLHRLFFSKICPK
jgi:hypothetical protein